jgi:hypothetical protein
VSDPRPARVADSGTGRGTAERAHPLAGGAVLEAAERLGGDAGGAGNVHALGAWGDGGEGGVARWGGEGGGAEGVVSGAFELDHEPVEELVDLVHLVAADGGLEADLLDLLLGEGRPVVGASGVGAVAEAGQVGGGPLQQAADLARAVAADDPGEGPRPDLLGRERAFGHAASSPLALGGHASSSVYLDPVDWQTGSGGAPGRFIR